MLSVKNLVRLWNVYLVTQKFAKEYEVAIKP